MRVVRTVQVARENGTGAVHEAAGSRLERRLTGTASEGWRLERDVSTAIHDAEK